MSKFSPFLCALVALAVGWSVPAARAQLPAPLADLTSIAELNRLLADPTQTVVRARTFRGVVTFVSRVGDFCVQAGPEGVMVEPPGGTARPALGDEVEVTADVKFQTSDLTDPDFFLRASGVRRVGVGQLPEPEKPSLAEALNGKSCRRWVEVEGVVMQAALERGVVMLHLTDTSGWAVVNVHDWREGTSLRDGWGARLRIRCANVSRGHRALRVASSDQITVLQPGTAELFAAPLADLAALRLAAPSAERMRVEGTVLAVLDGMVYVRSGTTALRATTLAPFTSAASAPHPLELIPPPAPEFQPGDQVEIVGSPLRVHPWLQLSFATFRRTQAGERPAPVECADPARAHATLCDLVRLTGRVQGYRQSTGAHGWLETLTLDSGGTVFQAQLESASGGQLALHREHDVLELTGVIIPDEHGQPPVLQLVNVKTLDTPGPAAGPRGLPPGVLRIIGLLAVGLALALAGAGWLQRQVRSRTAALAVANEALRAEVAVREQAEAELARTLELERELGELKNRFVSMVSHEFRTPLGIIMSAIELMRHYHDRLPAEQIQELQLDIFNSTQHMAGLMEQVLVLGRVEAGKLACQSAPCDLGTLAAKLADECHSATSRKCLIHWQAEGDLEGALADEALLRHILTNLLSNSVKYSPAGHSVEFTIRREGPDAVFKISDQGIGIPESDREHLYEAFQRGSNVGEIPGTGLGMVIIKRCVDLHGGTIQVDSIVGKGTTFTVRLPLFTP